MTGLDDVNSINRAYEVRATEFIMKPPNLEHALNGIGKALELLERCKSDFISRQLLRIAVLLNRLGTYCHMVWIGCS
jgi:DNA-binding NtrC family response regulator